MFIASPDPRISWSGQKQLPIGRYGLSNENTELVITNVRPSDEMSYTCKAANERGNAEYTIDVDVQGMLLKETDTSVLLCCLRKVGF